MSARPERDDEPGDPSDETLLQRYAAGDAAAFARLYDRHERAVHRYFRRHGIAGDAADDLLQDTWLAIVRNASTWRPDARFSTWLYTIARSKLVDHWRARRTMVPIDDAANDACNDADNEGAPAIERVAAGRGARPDVQAMSRQQARLFVDAVEALPAAQRDAFLLHVEGGLSLAEMAAVAAVVPETMKSRLRYAMARLRVACGAWLEARDEPGAFDEA